MPTPPKVSASVASADLSRLGEEVGEVVRAGADWIHVDVMDQRFGRGMTFGPLLCDALRRITRAPLDVHLMVEAADALVPACAEHGATLVTFHPEASCDVARTVALVKARGCRAGLALLPGTPLGALDDVLARLDLVVVMAVDPRFPGQRFDRSALDRLRAVRERVRAVGRPVAVAVDGGVTVENAAQAVAAGADVLVAGAALFEAPSPARAIALLKGVRPPRPVSLMVGGIA